MSKFKIIEYLVPSWSLPALVNGDFSGLNDDDEEMIKRFLDAVAKEYGNAFFQTYDPETEPEKAKKGFYRMNDIHQLGDDCQKAFILVDERKQRLMPGGIPKWIRCYDNGGESFDRYTVVFTGRYRHKTEGECLFIGMSENPTHPQGFGQHGGYCPWLHNDGQYHIDRPKYSHLGKPIKFEDLPEECQKVVLSDYMDLWDLN